MSLGPKRIIYLKNVSHREAGERWLKTLEGRGLLEPLGKQTIRVDDSLGRITAGPQFAAQSSPHEHSSAMDGYAVRFADTFGASQAEPKRLKLDVQAIPIDTGDPLPSGFNAVIMIEDVDQVSEGEIEITEPVTPWKHVRIMGEDIVATELILPENFGIRPVDLAALLAAGLVEIDVRRKPELGIIPTGWELVEPGDEMKRGSIIEFNSRLLAGMASEWGAQAIRLPVVGDDFDQIKAAVLKAAGGSDVVIINAGSSAGRHDYTVHAIDEVGEVLVHGVRIKPGKPTVLGIVNQTPVLGIPGFPVSAWLAMDLFAKPVIHALQGLKAPARPRVRVKISRKIPSAMGAEEFVRVKLGRVGERLVAAPVQRGAGALMSLARADGILAIPENSEGIRAEEEVEIDLLKGLEEIENTIVVVGSHDIALDILSSELKKTHPDLMLSSAHVGSLGGLMALKRGEAHMAGTHLLDEETGEYNTSYIERYLSNTKVMLVNLAFREQGLIVGKGNPLKIKGVEDLARDDVVFINRQNGAGTRILLDYHLRLKGIEPAQVNGYGREEYTHMAVAAAVLDGVAQAGMGILAAAKALDLDFIPVATERYDLAIPAEFLEMPQIVALIEVMRTGGFKDKVLALGGYDTSRTGEIVG